MGENAPIPYWAPASVSLFFHWGQTSSTAHDPVFRGWVPQFKIGWYSCADTLWIWGEDAARIGLSQNCGSHDHHWSPMKNEPFHQFWIITWGSPYEITIGWPPFEPFMAISKLAILSGLYTHHQGYRPRPWAAMAGDFSMVSHQLHGESPDFLLVTHDSPRFFRQRSMFTGFFSG